MVLARPVNHFLSDRNREDFTRLKKVVEKKREAEKVAKAAEMKMLAKLALETNVILKEPSLGEDNTMLDDFDTQDQADVIF